ncbi:MAG: hypothetical protein IJJ74_05090 [Eubacterium sp.]|nr:hypothetical protein [Eubacterium sp.]
MSAGLSMASVNKIKELAESRDYSVAVDILDAQDLEKSLNPQFVRTCGEVYENVGRYADARKQYVRAHIMADGNSKVIQSLIILYLKRGFKELAQKYYEQYIFIEKNSPRKLQDMEYIMKKAKKDISDEMYDILYPHYRDNMDEEWSYELILLSIVLGKLDGLDILVSDYLATFKNSKRIEFIEEAFMDKEKAREYFDIFSEDVVIDDAPEEEEVRNLEAEQLEKDYFIRNPKEPEILLMVDDLQDELTDKQKRKAQKKNRKELLKSMRKNSEQSGEGSEDGETSEEAEASEGAEAVEADALEEDVPVGESIKHSLKDFIKRKFRRENPKKDEEDSEETDSHEKTDSEDKKEPEDKKDSEDKTGKDEAEKKTEAENKSESEDKKDSEVKNESEAKTEERTESEEKKSEEVKPEEVPEEKKEEAAEKEAESVSDTSDDNEIIIEEVKADEPEAAEAAEGSEEDDMRELKPDTSIDDLITYDFDDGFAPESETIAELDDSSFDFSNPFDSISAYKKDEEEKKNSEMETFGKTLDDLRIELEINNVDESTSDHEPETVIVDEEIIDTLEEAVDTTAEETAEETIETEDEVFEEAVEDVVEEAVETVEETVEDKAETASEVSEETIGSFVEEKTVEEITETAADDYPKFSSSLFPEKEVKEVKNDFDDVVKSESNKLEEQLKKEEELQRQAEELLKSLGINL